MCEYNILDKQSGIQINPSQIMGYRPRLKEHIKGRPLPENATLLVDNERNLHYGILEINEESPLFYPLSEKFAKIPEDIDPQIALRLEEEALNQGNKLITKILR